MRALLVLGTVIALATPVAASHPLDLIAPVDGPIVRHFEPPPTPYSPGHRGIDFASPEGAPVVAVAGGVVAFAGQVGGDLFVSIDHDGGLRSTYSFLGQVLVERDQTVEQGELIATSGPGHPGEAAPSLHLGLRRGSEYLDPEAPLLESIRRHPWRVLSLTG